MGTKNNARFHLPQTMKLLTTGCCEQAADPMSVRDDNMKSRIISGVIAPSILSLHI
jgi:hypothetical protein